MLKRKRLVFTLGIVIVLGFLLVTFVRGKYVVPILMYHSVNPDATAKNRLALTPVAFQRQMRFLKEHKYNVLPLEAAANLIKDKKKIPAKTVVITFDDGYKDNYTYAFPVLKKYNLPATIFIIINEVGRPQQDRLSWDEIKAMQASGIITFGSHTLGPEPLVNIKSEIELRKEIFDAKKILQEKLGSAVNIFSYPGGLFNERIKNLVKEAGYKAAVVTNPGKRFPNDDIYALKRLRISSSSNNLFVFWVESSGYYNFMRESRHKK